MPDTFTDSPASVGSISPGDGGGSPPTQDPSASSAAGAIVQPESTPDPKGPVPYDRFEQINAKYKQLQWAESIDQDQVRQHRAFFEWLDRDPRGAHNYITDYLTRQGILQQQQGPPAAKDSRPQPDVIVPETGQKFYSAEAAEQLAKWQATQLLNERMGPVEQQLQSLSATHSQQQARAHAASLVAEARTWPHYETHEAQILQEMEKDRRLSLEGAYRRVVMPKLRTLEREAIVKELNDKRGAATVNPGASTPTERTQTTKMAWGDLFKREMARKR